MLPHTTKLITYTKITDETFTKGTTDPKGARLLTSSTIWVKWVSAFGLSNNNKWRWWVWFLAAYRRTHSPGSFGLVWGSAAAWRRAIFITWTRWTLAVALSYDDSTINIVVGIIIIIIIIIIICLRLAPPVHKYSTIRSSAHRAAYTFVLEQAQRRASCCSRPLQCMLRYTHCAGSRLQYCVVSKAFN